MKVGSSDAPERLGEITIPARFNGPEQSANGGYACGVLARFLPEPAQVTLRLPPPLERPLRVAADGEGGVRLLDGEVLIAEGEPAALDPADPPVRPSLAEAEDARSKHPGIGVTHPLSGCFVCGPEREDGLGVSFGPLAGHEEVGAAPFVPDDSVAVDGVVPGEIVWAALDCVSYVPSMWSSLETGEGISLLGRLTAERHREVEPGEDLVAIGWPLESDGRKQHTASALIDPEGEVVAHAEATWIRLEG